MALKLLGRSTVASTDATLEAGPRPFLKWAGGKGQLLSQYQAYFPKHYSTYYEPFLGGGAVFFSLQSQQERSCVLTDLNPELVNVYRVVQQDVAGLIELLQEHQRQHCQEYYYAVRSQYELPGLQRAARFIYLNKTCYNGLYRENRQGRFNVPMGRYQRPMICNEAVLRAAARLLRSAQILEADFKTVLERATGAEDFVYFDPPYHPLSATSSFTGYSRFAFGEAEQVALRDTFVALAAMGVQVMLSNSDCAFVRQLYSGFPIHTIEATRAINSKTSRRGKITEVLVTSFS